MDNNFNQQPQYQQPQYQQPQYQQPQYQQPVSPKGPGIDGIVDILVKATSIIVLVFLGLGALGFVYYFFAGIISFVANNLVNPGFIFNGLVSGISIAAKYCFYALVVAYLSKIFKK